MSTLPGGAPLARALLSLARSRLTGTLVLATAERVHRVAIAAGAPVAIETDRSGTMAGMTVTLGEALSAELLDYRFESASRARASASTRVRPAAAFRLLVAAAELCLADRSLAGMLASLSAGPLYATAVGRRLVLDELDDPESQRLFALLTAGRTLAELRRAVADREPALVRLCALYALGLIGHERQGAACYSLLLRKRMQLRKAVSPHALLDLPPGARPTQARRALWLLARKLHPDCLGPDVPAALRDASGEVMGALIRAETQLRAARPAP